MDFCIFGLKIFEEGTRVSVWITEGLSGLEAVLPCGNEAARIFRVWGLKIKFERVIAGDGIEAAFQHGFWEIGSNSGVNASLSHIWNGGKFDFVDGTTVVENPAA